MSQNGTVRSPILDPSGERVETATMEAPSGSSPWFGWLGDNGYATVRIESIQVVVPNPQRRDEHIIGLSNGANLGINGEDCQRLMRRLGWTQKSTLARATQ